VAVGEVKLERERVDPPGDVGMEPQRLPLAREDELRAVVPVPERLLADPVAREQQRPLLAVPRGDREHAVEARERVRAPLLDRVHGHLGVAVRPELVVQALQLAPELAKVVDLAVQDEPQVAASVCDRLLAARRVDDREPPETDRDVGILEPALVVGPAVPQGRHHAAEQVVVALLSDVAADPAHRMRIQN
jgi:hypothetical protein